MKNDGVKKHWEIQGSTRTKLNDAPYKKFHEQ